MTARGDAVLLACVAALALSAAAALAADARRDARRAASAATFHGATGSLGLGPATDLARCDGSFDPRLASRCPERWFPLPGGACFCPHRPAPTLGALADGEPREGAAR